MPKIISETRIALLRADLAGEVILPGDPHYEQHRKVWNADFDLRPAMIVRTVRVEDVVATLAFARMNGLEITVRSGGHSFSGQSVADGALIIDLRRMNRVAVDPGARRVWVEAGANWGEVDQATQLYGLAVTGGQVSHTGVAGLTLGGGLGYTMRTYGLTIDHLVSAEMVTADGRIVRAGAHENEDLFFGLRGGGGNFGIVTQFEFRLNPVGPIVLGGHLGWSREQGPEFLRRYVEFLRICPDELMTTLVYLDMPPLPFVPCAMRKKPGWLLAVCGIDIAKAEATLALLSECGPPQFNVVQPMPYLAVQSFLDKAEPFGTKLYGKSHLFGQITEETLLTLHEQFADLPSHETKAFLLQMGGVVKRVRDEDMAFTGRQAEMAVMFEAEWKDNRKREQCIAWVRRVWSASEKFAQGTYNNFSRNLDENTLKAIYGASKYQKLQQLKTKYDPANVFHRNHNIKPITPSNTDAKRPAVLSSKASKMRVRHIVVGAFDVAESAAFYRDVFGFTDLGESTPQRQTILYQAPDGRDREHLELEFVKTVLYWQLPNPYHLAFETDLVSFEKIYTALKKRNAKVLSAPSWEPDNGGYGDLKVRGVNFRCYFFVDPNLIYLEVMNRLATAWTKEAHMSTQTLQINHLVIGARDVEESVAFYTGVFGFKDRGENPHAAGARNMVHYSADGNETLEVVVHPFGYWLTPNPPQISLEVDADTFESIRAATIKRQATVFAEPDPELQGAACSQVEVRGIAYKRFFVFDPSLSRIEVTTRSCRAVFNL